MRSHAWWLYANGDVGDDGCCAGPPLWIDVGICGADCHTAAECLACIALACRKRGRGSQKPILSSSFCNGLRIHRSERCQRCSRSPHDCVLCTWLCGIHCVPWRGATALRGMQHGHGRVVIAAAAALSPPPAPPPAPPPSAIAAVAADATLASCSPLRSGRRRHRHLCPPLLPPGVTRV